MGQKPFVLQGLIHNPQVITAHQSATQLSEHALHPSHHHVLRLLHRQVGTCAHIYLIVNDQRQHNPACCPTTQATWTAHAKIRVVSRTAQLIYAVTSKSTRASRRIYNIWVPDGRFATVPAMIPKLLTDPPPQKKCHSDTGDINALEFIDCCLNYGASGGGCSD